MSNLIPTSRKGLVLVLNPIQVNWHFFLVYIFIDIWLMSNGVAYMVSSCSKTVMPMDPYISCFEDEFGNIQEKELPQPTLLACFMDFSH